MTPNIFLCTFVLVFCFLPGLLSIKNYKERLEVSPFKFYVLRNGSYSNTRIEGIKADYRQSQFSEESEEWLDYSGGEGSVITDILEDPDFNKLFSMESGTISDKSGIGKLFHWGHPDYRTKDNCFIMGLHSGAELETITQFIKSLEIFNGTTTDKLLYSMKGILICFPERVLPLTLLQKIPWLKLVERDSVFRATQIQDNSPWGLSRISNPALPVSGKFGFRYTGKGVDIYVMDSGVNTKHQGINFKL